MLLTLTLFGVLVCAGYWLLVRFEDRGQLQAPFILAAMPLAAMLPAAAVPLTSVVSIQAFQAIARTGHSNARISAMVATGIAQPLALASAGFVFALLVAGGLHVLHAGSPTPIDDAAPAPAGHPSGHIVLFLAAVLALPVLGLVRLVGSIAPVIQHAGLILRGPNPPATVDGMPLARLSAVVSGRLVVGSLGGGALLLLVIGGGVVSLVAARSSGRSAAIERAAWIVYALALAGGIWTSAVLVLDLLSLQRGAPV